MAAAAKRTNLDLTFELLDAMGKPRSLIRYVKDRPGHDRRYAIDSSKLSASSVGAEHLVRAGLARNHSMVRRASGVGGENPQWRLRELLPTPIRAPGVVAAGGSCSGSPFLPILILRRDC